MNENNDSIINIKSLAKDAETVLPPEVFAFICGGSLEERTLARNRAKLDEVLILPRILKALNDVSTQVNILGHKLKAPVLIAPTAFQKLLSPSGELDMLEAVNQFNTIMIASMFSSVDYAKLAKRATNPIWLQMYLLKERAINKDLIFLAEELGFSALVITVDTPVYATRAREKAKPLSLSGVIDFQHLNQIGIPVEKCLNTKGHFSQLLDSNIGWQDIEWIAGETELPIILKGILNIEDIKIALTYPMVKGVIISNHGGRQLDSTFSAIELIQEHRQVVGDKLTLFLDGGILRGSDVFKALALGADAALIGRQPLWALSVGGSMGVLQLLNTLQSELWEIMTLTGCGSVRDITSDFVKVTF